MAVDVLYFFLKCIRSQSKRCHSLSKQMSVSSSHLDSSWPHVSSRSKPLSSEVPGTRWFPTDCYHNISGFLYTHWSCTCHNVHSQSGCTNPTWIWVLLLCTHSYNSQWWGILWCVKETRAVCNTLPDVSGIQHVRLVLVWLHVQLVLAFHLPRTLITHKKTCTVLLSWKCVTSLSPMNVCWCNSYNIRNFASISTCTAMLFHVLIAVNMKWLPWTLAAVTSVHFLAAVGVPRMVSLAPLPTRGAVRITWSPPTDLCGLTNPQYTIQYGRTTSTPTTHSITPSSSPFNITGLEVGQEYFVSVAVRTQSGTFSSWESVTTFEGEGNVTACYTLNSPHL